MHDLLLTGGSVLDGTGAPATTADVAVTDGRISALGRVGRGDARRCVDVAGAVVCPGFIDLHSHADFTVMSQPRALTQPTQGVTTLVTGNCGFSPFPVTPGHADELRHHANFLDDGLTWEWQDAAGYAAAVGALPLAVNLALQIGHGALRIAAMGTTRRAPTAAELDTMRGMLRTAAAQGVVGMSSGLIYPPGAYAAPTELVALCREAAAAGLLYSTHLRDEADQLTEAVAEALATARESGVRLQISHLKATGPRNWGTVGDALGAIDAARAAGVDVAADQYPYTASSTTLTSRLPAWVLDGGVPAMLRRLDDPSQRARIVAELRAMPDLPPERVVIAETPAGTTADSARQGQLAGRTLADAATILGVDAAEATVEILRAAQGAVAIVSHAMSAEDVATVLRHPQVAVASDGWILRCPGSGAPHPRSFGTFPRVLGHYARDAGTVDLPTAVRKMTSLPASRLGWHDRGTVRLGAVADLAVFDPVHVADRATFDNPWQLSTGILHTLVAGTFTLHDGHSTADSPGQVIRTTRT